MEHIFSLYVYKIVDKFAFYLLIWNALISDIDCDIPYSNIAIYCYQ